jgi:iron complex transport system permease protein
MVTVPIVAGIAILIGRYPQPGITPLERILTDPLAQRLVWELRVPRVLIALLLGATLGAAGLVLQMLFANPLVEPGLIGVSQGAAFGAAAVIVFVGNRPVILQISAAFWALAGLLVAYQIARRLRFGGWILRLVLSGIAVSALFSSAVGILKYMADPLDQLPEITFWMLGGLWNSSWPGLFRIAPATIIGLTIVYLRRYRLNVLSLQDRISFSLGARPDQERLVLLIAATVATAAVISQAGIIGWVGLIVPHSARRLFRADALVALPAAAMIGSIFTILADTAARTLVAGEIPLGIITSLVGAMVFIALLVSHNIRLER